MSEQAAGSEQDFIGELEDLIKIAKHPKTTKLLKWKLQETKSALTRKAPENSDGSRADNQEEVIGAVQTSSLGTKKIVPVAPSTSKIKEYGWDQSDKFVKLYVSNIPSLEQVSQKDVTERFSERSIEIEVKVGSKIFSLNVKDLLDVIVPEKCSVKVKSEMIIVMLRKSSSRHWEHLTTREKKLGDTKEGKPPKLGENEDPGTGLMKLMKKMYDEGDDEMKRTMSKAWSESQEKRAKGDESLI